MPDKINAVVEAAGDLKPLKFLEHNRWAVLALVVTLALTLSCTFLRARVPNPLHPDSPPLDREGLQLLSARWAADVEAQSKVLMAADEALAAKEAWIGEVIEAVQPFAVTAAGPYGSIVTMGFGLLTGGLLLDNRRKGSLLAQKKTPVVPSPLVV